MVEDALDRFGGEARGDGLDGQPEAHDSLGVVAAAEQHLVIGHFAAVDFAGVAEEAEVGDPVVAAGVGAAAGLDGQAADQRVVVGANGFLERDAQVHGLGEAEVAAIGAGASEDVIDLVGAARRPGQAARARCRPGAAARGE